MAAKVRLPGKRLFTLKGNEVELAVGLLLVAVLEAQPAEATITRDGLAGLLPEQDALTPQLAPEAPQTLEQLLGIAPDAVKTISISELEAHLTPAVLASLGLDDRFLDLLEHDRKAAIRSLESAYRKKLAALGNGDGHHAVAKGDAHAGHAHGASDGDQDSLFTMGGHEISPLLILAGLAVAGGGIALATTGGNGDKEKPPVATNDTFTTAEDTPTTIDVRTNDTDPNGDALTVTQINGTNITTTAPVSITGGVISLGTDGRLTFTPTANYNGAPTFTYTISDGRGGTSTATVTGTVTAVNDAPVNTVPTGVTAAPGAAVAVAGLAISDVDGPGPYTTTITASTGVVHVGTVTGGATVTVSPSGAVVLTGTIAQIDASLGAVTYTGATTGTATLTIATSDGTATTTSTVPITVAQAVAGVAQDGYLSGSRVFIDANHNGQYDVGEPTAITDANGKFAFNSSVTGPILVIGGINTDTGLANTLTLSAPAGSSVINPLTTMVQQLMSTGLSLADAKAAVSTALHLPAGVDVTSFDFLSPNVDPAVALSVQKIAVEIATVLSLASAGAANAADALSIQQATLKSLGAMLSSAAASGTSLDLTDSATIHSALTGANAILAAAAAADPTGQTHDLSLSAAQTDAVSAHAAAVNDAVDHATSPTDLATSVAQLSPTNGPPIAGVDTVTVDEDGHVVFNVLDNDVDPAGTALTLTKIGTIDVVPGAIVGVEGGTVLVGANGQLTFTPNPDYNGAPTFTYTVTDANGLSSVGTVGVTVTPVNDAPVAVADTATTAAGHAVTIDVLANDSDVDGDHLSVTSIDGQLISADHPVQVTGGTVSLGAGGQLIFTPTNGYSDAPHFNYTVSDGNGGTAVGQVDVAVTFPDGVLPLDPANLDGVVSHASLLASEGVTTLDVVGDALTIDGSQAAALIGAGLHFADADTISLAPSSGEGTHLSSTLKSLQDLHIDMVRLTGDAASIDAGGGLGGINASALPHFVGATGGDPSVTLNVTGGALDTTVDLGTIATSLATAGIDHINATAPITIDFAQAEALHGAGLDFSAASDVTMTFSAADDLSIDDAIALHVDHLDFQGGTLDLTAGEAAAAIGAGIDFAQDDNVVVHSEGTHIATTLKGLADLHVDFVRVTGTALVIDAGTSLAGLSAETLPHFVSDTTGLPMDVTVTLAGGTLDPTTDISTIAHSLSTAGIEHIGISGDGEMTLTGDQALSLADAGVNFAQAADITLHLDASQVGLVTADALGAADFGVDHLNVDGAVSITDADASALVAAGIDFAASDTVSVHASGTHLSSTLSDLQKLNVDTVAVDGGVTHLHVDAGDLAALAAATLPQFDVAQSDASLDVTLHVDGSELAKLATLETLATSLRDAGIDHFGLDQPIDSYDTATQIELAKITAASGINFVYDPETSYVRSPVQYGTDDAHLTSSYGDQSLVSQIVEAFDHASDHGTGGHVVVQDDVIPALAESGALRAYTADTLVVDGTHTGGDQLLTTLKDIASLGVDKVMVTDTGGPSYVDIGTFSQFSGDELTQVKQLFATLEQNVPATSSIFSGTTHGVGLVVDEDTAHAISQVDGATEKLAAMGFTQLDVLMNSGSTTPPITSTAVEVKLIGQDDDLYKHLHHDQ